VDGSPYLDPFSCADKSLVRIGTAGTLVGREPRRPQSREAGEHPDRARFALAMLNPVELPWSPLQKNLNSAELKTLFA